VLVTGITGSGKTTTLAAMVDEINAQRTGVIISIEDPIEYIFTHKLCRVKQREIGSDTKSFPEALRHVLRQDPDVILISEMRDLETIAAAITAAETGHLVLGTLHTIDAPKAIDRIVDAFPADQQAQIVAQLANALQAIIAQRLLPRADGKGRIVCTEVMVMNDAIRALLRDRKFQQVLSMIEIGSRDGMITFDESVSNLYATGQITYAEALLNARDPDRINSMPPPHVPEAEAPKKKGFFGM
jgi:twitching motility protein PilT